MKKNKSAHSVNVRELSDLIGSIYDCALEPALWPETLAKMSHFLHAENAVILIIDNIAGAPRLQFHTNWNADPAAIAEFNEKYAVDNPLSVFRGFAPDTPFNVLSIMTEREYKATRLYHGFAAPRGWLDSFGVNITRNAFRSANISFVRLEANGFAGQRELEALRLLSPHIRRAISISDLLGMQKVKLSNLSASLDVVASCVFLLDEGGAVVHANRAASEWQDLGKGKRLFAAGILAKGNSNCDRVHSALGECAVNAKELTSGTISIPLETEDGAVLIAHVLPLGGSGGRSMAAGSAVAALFIAEQSGMSVLPTDVWAAAFGVTKAEGKVLESLCGGMNAIGTAQRLGLTEATVRTHLKRLFQKIGASSQAELVLLAMKYAPTSALSA